MPEDLYARALSRLSGTYADGSKVRIEWDAALPLLRALLVERQLQHSSMSVTKEMVQAGVATDAALREFAGGTE